MFVVCKFVINSVRARKFTGNVIYHVLRLLHGFLIRRKHVSNFFFIFSTLSTKYQNHIWRFITICFAFFPNFFYNEVSMRLLLCVIKKCASLKKRKQSTVFFSLWDLGIFFHNLSVPVLSIAWRSVNICGTIFLTMILWWVN